MARYFTRAAGGAAAGNAVSAPGLAGHVIAGAGRYTQVPGPSCSRVTARVPAGQVPAGIGFNPDPGTSEGNQR